MFIANAGPDSQVTVMTLIKQSSAIVTIVAGKVIYKEKISCTKPFAQE